MLLINEPKLHELIVSQIRLIIFFLSCDIVKTLYSQSVHVFVATLVKSQTLSVQSQVTQHFSLSFNTKNIKDVCFVSFHGLSYILFTFVNNKVLIGPKIWQPQLGKFHIYSQVSTFT